MVRAIRAMGILALVTGVVIAHAATIQQADKAEVTALESTTPSAPVDYSGIVAALPGAGSANEGSTKASGRCIAIANDTGTYKLKLKVLVYAEEDEGYFSRGWRLVKSLGKEQQVITREYELDPGELISFNQKPRIDVAGVAKGAAGTALLGLPGLFFGGTGTEVGSGKYIYLAGLGIAGTDTKTGKSIFADETGDGPVRALGTIDEEGEDEFVMLTGEELEKINHFIQNLTDHEACKESDEQKSSAFIVIRRESPPDALKDILDKDDPKHEEFLANVDDDVTIVVPFREEKSFFGRLKLHMTQHPNSFKAIENVLKAALAMARLAAGDASAVSDLSGAFKGLSDSALSALKNQIGYSESASQIDQLSGLVKSAKSIGEAAGGLDKLLGNSSKVVDGVKSATKSEHLKEAAGKLKDSQSTVKSALSSLVTGDRKKASKELAQAAAVYFKQAEELDKQELDESDQANKDMLQLVAASEGSALVELQERIEAAEKQEEGSPAGQAPEQAAEGNAGDTQ